jgi:hypothetical protein
MRMEILSSISGHPTEDTLEEYSFGRVAEPALAEVEEHLLVCPLCQGRLAEIDQYKALMRTALSHPGRRTGSVWFRSLQFPIPRFVPRRVWAGACVVAVGLMVALAWGKRPHSTPPSAAVILVAMRGADPGGIAHAPARALLDLKIDTRDLPPAPQYRLQMVNATGYEVWNASVRPMDGEISAHSTRGWPAGIYWVRLYTPGGDLLREFGLRLGVD